MQGSPYERTALLQIRFSLVQHPSPDGVYDISGLLHGHAHETTICTSTDCAHCRRRQHLARTIDDTAASLRLLTLRILAFSPCSPRPSFTGLETIAHLKLGSLHGHLYHTPITVSLEAAAIAGVVISFLLWVLVAIATPIPTLVTVSSVKSVTAHPCHSRTHHEERRLSCSKGCWLLVVS